MGIQNFRVGVGFSGVWVLGYSGGSDMRSFTKPWQLLSGSCATQSRGSGHEAVEFRMEPSNPVSLNDPAKKIPKNTVMPNFDFMLFFVIRDGGAEGGSPNPSQVSSLRVEMGRGPLVYGLGFRVWGPGSFGYPLRSVALLSTIPPPATFFSNPLFMHDAVCILKGREQEREERERERERDRERGRVTETQSPDTNATCLHKD